MNSMMMALVNTGVAIRTRTAVTRTVHVSNDIRNSVIPGARILKIVTRKLTAPRMELVPTSASPTIQRSWPGPSEASGRSCDSGL
jgi:hypothetical protein